MNVNWIYNPADFEEKSFAPIPEGDHRLRISDAVSKTFNSGNTGFEITFEVSGFNSRLWHYLVLDANDTKKTNQRIGGFFEAFGITDYDLSHYRNWVGKVGAARIRHEDYKGEPQAKVRYFLTQKNQSNLPAAKFSDIGPAAANNFAAVEINDSELPFY